MQIFPRTLNYLPLVGAVVTAVLGGAVTFVFWYYFSPKNLQVGYQPEQPIAYSHQLHAGQLGMDCRYCHASVEESQEAMVPPSQTCMGCHAIVRADSPALAELRARWAENESVPWVRVHKLPEHAYFDHSVHVVAGVGCATCHGRVDQMAVVEVSEPLSMGWCLECHRDFEPNLRPPNRVTDMDWGLPIEGGAEGQLNRPDEHLIAEADTLNPPEHCSGCHR